MASTPLGHAVFSSCGRHRYLLTRTFGEGGTCLFVLLNPSTATAEKDDPTIRKVKTYARDFGYGRLAVVNLFSYRATNPAALRKELVTGGLEATVGPDNDEYILAAAKEAAQIVLGFGAGVDTTRATRVRREMRTEALYRLLAPFDLYALERTGEGLPGHPLYLSGSLRPFLYRAKTEPHFAP